MITLFLLSFYAHSEIIFNLKNPIVKEKKKKDSSFVMKRTGFKFNENFLIHSSSTLFKKGTILKGYMEKEVFATDKTALPVYVKVYKPKSLFLGEIKALQNTSNALVSLNKVLLNEKTIPIDVFPIILQGDKKEAFLKEILLNFFLELPKNLSFLFKRSFHFFDSQKINLIEKEKKELSEYLVIKQTKPIKIIIK